MNSDCRVVSCVLQPQNQTKVNTELSLPAEAAAGRGAVPKPQIPHKFPPGPRSTAGAGALRCPQGGTKGVPAGTLQLGSYRGRRGGHPAGGRRPRPVRRSRGPAAPPVSRSRLFARRARLHSSGGPGSWCREAGGSPRPSLLLSYGALVCFLTGCNRTSNFLLFPKRQPSCHVAGALACAPDSLSA